MRISLLALGLGLFSSTPALAAERPEAHADTSIVPTAPLPSTDTAESSVVPEEQAAKSKPIAIPKVEKVVDSESRPMISQGDPVWRNEHMSRRATVGAKGCLAAAVYDVFLTMGIITASPVGFIERLVRYGMFTATGALYWALDRLFPVTTTRLRLRGAAAFAEAKHRLAAGSHVVLQVLTPRGTLHWVVASRIIGGDLEIRDPDGGRITRLGERYSRNALRGLAVITRR